MSTQTNILLIEDDQLLAETTRSYLENYGFNVRHCADGLDGWKALQEGELPELVLLDLMLPGIDGLEICKRMRNEQRTKRVPILMLTARGEETDRVVGLELGADDYLPKPYSLRELVARIRAILRRAEMSKESGAPEALESSNDDPSFVAQAGNIRIDRRKREVFMAGDLIDLTATEFELLWVFVSSPEQVFSREQLLDRVRGREFEIFDRSVDMHVSKLRKKLEKDPKKPQMLKTVWGVGYQFFPEK